MPDQTVSPDTHRVFIIPKIGNVAVPRDTPMADFHAAIMAHPAYAEPAAPTIEESENAPVIPNDVNRSDITEQGAIENQPRFKKAAKQAWDETLMDASAAMFSPQATGSKYGHTEAGFTVSKEGKVSPVSKNSVAKDETGGSLEQHPNDDTAILLHTHPPLPNTSQRPSPADIAIAKQLKKPILVASREGLFEIDAQGNVSQIYKDPSWMGKKK